MKYTTWIWISYIVGALLTLVCKWSIYCYEGKKLKKKISTCTMEWLFEKSASNSVSWATTVGVVWVGGYLYVERINYFVPTTIPVAIPIAFLLGSLMEVWTPNITKWILSRMPFGHK
jgi:hypothetical protein